MDANESLYAAAVAGMQSVYGTPRYAIGEGVAFRLEGWSPSSYADGVVRGYDDKGMLVVDSDFDVVTLDPRPWPIGNVLPF